jgi:hypothetical protein
VLARWLMGAKWGEFVCYRDGDTLNLCRSNLELMGRKEFIARTLGGPGLAASRPIGHPLEIVTEQSGHECLE